MKEMPLQPFPKVGHTPKKRYTGKAEVNALTFVYIPSSKPVRIIADKNRWGAQMQADWDAKPPRPVQVKNLSSPKRTVNPQRKNLPSL
jgi:hypothetical protein